MVLRLARVESWVHRISWQKEALKQVVDGYPLWMLRRDESYVCPNGDRRYLSDGTERHRNATLDSAGGVSAALHSSFLGDGRHRTGNACPRRGEWRGRCGAHRRGTGGIHRI